MQTIPLPDALANVPLVGFQQYDVVVVSFKIPHYDIGSFYTYTIELG